MPSPSVAEAPEFTGKALDSLRQPLEAGHVVVARSAGVVRLPARFLMVATCALSVTDRPESRYAA
ncbi:magnesium chelatase subunit ChlI-like protein [Streptomyces sp. TLI_146]|nr:ATP-binding protein [Streptomyces sp. TLI_146]PKV88205.1 magnesium chelatase subunit ChlI-like protein [Streptomyces sp. TLI_146]